jgi:hypothetical protein
MIRVAYMEPIPNENVSALETKWAKDIMMGQRVIKGDEG